MILTTRHTEFDEQFVILPNENRDNIAFLVLQNKEGTGLNSGKKEIHFQLIMISVSISVCVSYSYYCYNDDDDDHGINMNNLYCY